MAAETLLDALADTLEDAEAERPSHTQGNVEMKALIDTIADTPLERKGITILETLGDVDSTKVLYTLVDTVGKTEAG